MSEMDERIEEEHRLKRHNTYLWAALLAVIGIAAAVTMYFYDTGRKAQLALENQYNRAFDEVVDYVRDINVSLNKGLVASSPSQLARLSSEIYMQSSEASSNLGQLPLWHVQLENTAKFLSQVADYTYMLSQKSISNTDISDEEYATMQSLSSYARKLYDNLSAMQGDLFGGKLDFARLQKEGNEYLNKGKEPELNPMSNVEKEFQDYPSLIYDGPFSEHMEKLESVFLKGKEEIGQDEAQVKAKEFLSGYKLAPNNQTEDVALTGQDDGSIPTYSFTAQTSDNSNISMDISRAGGHVVWMLCNKNVDQSKLSFEEATEHAMEFLKERGYQNMKQSYYETRDNIATINFAYTQDGIIMYPDLIKVKVSMYDGEILGFESKGYLMSHQDRRSLPTAAISMEEARAKINDRLTINRQAMAVIPTDSKEEVLCYEFIGNTEGQNFIIYINAVTGEEERILLLLESDEGILTM